MEIKILQLVRQSVKSFAASLRLFPLSSPHWLSLAFRSKYPCTQMMGYQPQYYILSHSQGRKVKRMAIYTQGKVASALSHHGDVHCF